MPKDLKDLTVVLLNAVAAVELGTIPPAVGNCLANLGWAVVSCYEVATLEERLDRIEAQMVREGRLVG